MILKASRRCAVSTTRKVPDKGKRMNVILFGATGMVGQAATARVPSRSRGQAQSSTIVPQSNRPARRQATRARSQQISSTTPPSKPISPASTPASSVIGVTSAGMSEAQYTRVTHDLTLAAATTLAKLNPSMTFIYVSGSGTDSTERGRSMWARVKGKTENDILKLPFKAVLSCSGIGFIQPLHGIVSKTTVVSNLLLSTSNRFLPLMRKHLSHVQIGTTEQIGRAMLLVVKHGFPRPVLESKDINTLRPPSEK